ncbi:hypothetical protein [Pseudoduganella chitinolytica]|uniref:Copper-binding protein n=1 Tax=Pseudoduganella chitinolytica TaxID=34070 RepID=A0ABY8BB91_9BURK|nr:hypothetical protein [Pseudoduganella chitinolytica]WEF32966.1 hypothetical protein PX653_26845 [Pseudoduganella chitinolytica]
MKKIAAMIALGLACAASVPATAHESAAKHGGIVKSAGDLSFELVNKDGKTTIYVEDHDATVPTAGASGTLTVLKGAQKSETALAAGPGNTLVAKDAVRLEAGNKVVARIALPNKAAVSVRFAIK